MSYNIKVTYEYYENTERDNFVFLEDGAFYCNNCNMQGTFSTHWEDDYINSSNWHIYEKTDVLIGQEITVDTYTIDYDNYTVWNRTKIAGDGIYIYDRGTNTHTKDSIFSIYPGGWSTDGKTSFHLGTNNRSSILDGELRASLGSWSVTSWSGAKHSIETLENKYDILFD
jgi:hypothetical protein